MSLMNSHFLVIVFRFVLSCANKSFFLLLPFFILLLFFFFFRHSQTSYNQKRKKNFLDLIMSQTRPFPMFDHSGQFRADGKSAQGSKFNLQTLLDFSNL